LRCAGNPPLFQAVEADERSLQAYIGELVRGCAQKGVTFRFNIDVGIAPELLAAFDRIVIATGARYRFGLGRPAVFMLDRGLARWPGLRRLFSSPRFRDWFYYRARRGTIEEIRSLVRPGQKVVAIGDAVAPGKTKEAIATTFAAALLAGRQDRLSRNAS
jgi:hypothetical protein